MARSYTFRPSVTGLEVWIEYQVSNLRIQSASWIVPAGATVRALVWDSGVPVVNMTLTGTGSANIPGNYRLEQYIDQFGEPGLRLPSNLTYRFECEVGS